MTFDLHIVNKHRDKDGFLVMSEKVKLTYRKLLQESYKKFYISKKKFPDGPAEISFNENTQLWERVLKIRNFENPHKARNFAFEWANRPGFSKSSKLNARETAGCSLDILIVNENGTVVEEISSDELYSIGLYGKHKGDNKPTDG